jgi:23S rRNA (guanosine2251-2'-O)-methyltransferase
VTRHDLGGVQVEGRRAVRELLVAGARQVHDVWLLEDAEEAGPLSEIADLALARQVPVRRVRRNRLLAEARTEAPQGVLAHADPLSEAGLPELCRPRAGHAPFLVVLDGVTDPLNLGALLRTAECAGATGVVLPRRRAAHVTPTVAKAAAGAIERLRIAVTPGIPTALRELARQGVWTVGLDVRGTESLFGLELAEEPLALVLGAEGRGLGRLARQTCDLLVSIPQRGRLASLNVAAAGAVACFFVAQARAEAAARRPEDGRLR